MTPPAALQPDGGPGDNAIKTILRAAIAALASLAAAGESARPDDAGRSGGADPGSDDAFSRAPAASRTGEAGACVSSAARRSARSMSAAAATGGSSCAAAGSRAV